MLILSTSLLWASHPQPPLASPLVCAVSSTNYVQNQTHLSPQTCSFSRNGTCQIPRIHLWHCLLSHLSTPDPQTLLFFLLNISQVSFTLLHLFFLPPPFSLSHYCSRFPNGCLTSALSSLLILSPYKSLSVFFFFFKLKSRSCHLPTWKILPWLFFALIKLSFLIHTIKPWFLYLFLQPHNMPLCFAYFSI